MESWRPIPDLPGYEASNVGRIRSLDRLVVWRCKGRVLKPKIRHRKWGGIYWSFHKPSTGEMSVHRAVCSAFKGKAPSPKHEAAHLDNDTSNNRPDNLAWLTRTENERRKRLNGTAPIGMANGRAKLNDQQVREIAAMKLTRATTIRSLAGSYGVSIRNIKKIRAGMSWTHLIHHA